MVDTLVVVEYLICSLVQGSWLHVLSVTMIDPRSMIARWIVQLIDSGLDDDSQHYWLVPICELCINFCSQGPEDDVEEESELSVTELKQQREKQKREAEVLKAAYLEDQEKKKAALTRKADDGCSWGMGKLIRFIYFSLCVFTYTYLFLSSTKYTVTLIANVWFTS